MNVFRYEKPKADHAFIGTWHICEMEDWDEGYFNMEPWTRPISDYHEASAFSLPEPST